jgi:hypothetical protein
LRTAGLSDDISNAQFLPAIQVYDYSQTPKFDTGTVAWVPTEDNAVIHRYYTPTSETPNLHRYQLLVKLCWWEGLEVITYPVAP